MGLNPVPVLGSWRLISLTATDEGGERIALPMGPSPRGLIMYSADGFMSAQLAGMRTEDTPWDWCVDASAAYLGYCGTYEYTEGRIVHHVRLASSSEWAGIDLVRIPRLTGTELTLRSAGAVGAWPFLVAAWRPVSSDPALSAPADRGAVTW
jgi:hypothetical protein